MTGRAARQHAVAEGQALVSPLETSTECGASPQMAAGTRQRVTGVRRDPPGLTLRMPVAELAEKLLPGALFVGAEES